MTVRTLLITALLFLGSASPKVMAEKPPIQEWEDLSEPQVFDPDNPPLDLEKEKRILTWDEEEELRAAAEEEKRIHGVRDDEETRFLESLTDKKPKRKEPK